MCSHRHTGHRHRHQTGEKRLRQQNPCHAGFPFNESVAVQQHALCNRTSPRQPVSDAPIPVLTQVCQEITKSRCQVKSQMVCVCLNHHQQWPRAQAEQTSTWRKGSQVVGSCQECLAFAVTGAVDVVCQQRGCVHTVCRTQTRAPMRKPLACYFKAKEPSSTAPIPVRLSALKTRVTHPHPLTHHARTALFTKKVSRSIKGDHLSPYFTSSRSSHSSVSLSSLNSTARTRTTSTSGGTSSDDRSARALVVVLLRSVGTIEPDDRRSRPGLCSRPVFAPLLMLLVLVVVALALAAGPPPLARNTPAPAPPLEAPAPPAEAAGRAIAGCTGDGLVAPPPAPQGVCCTTAGLLHA